jgi:plasmid stabilization system protein ParE
LSVRLVKSNWFKADLLAAFAWYHQQAGRDVANRLARNVRDVIRVIQAYPEIAPIRKIAGVPIRSFPLHEFPFVIYWDLDGETVVFAAFLHGSRDRSGVLGARYPWRS